MKKKYLYWTPRILSIVFILFLSLFSFDVFENGLGFWGTVLALLIHLIPSFILVILLIISWKHELVGGMTFIFAGLLYIIMILLSALKNKFEWYMLSWSIQISGLAFFIGILWILNWKNKKKLKNKR
jgi:hypothetical protein